MQEITKQSLLPAFQNLTVKEIKELAINFSVSELSPIERAKITYWLKKLSKEIEAVDKGLQEVALKDYYNNAKDTKFGTIEYDGLAVVKTEKSGYDFSDKERAKEIQEQIEVLKNELDALKVEKGKTIIYYLKEIK